MASTSTIPDSMVTLKVNHEGTIRRFKLPLRDMGASTLEAKLRALLAIPPRSACRFERYSDSAGTYVVLDPNNVSVYKQLYRAAKAKSKLKIRVVMPELPSEEKQVPKPVTVEDEPEPPESQGSGAEEEKPADATPEPKPVTTDTEPLRGDVGIDLFSKDPIQDGLWGSAPTRPCQRTEVEFDVGPSFTHNGPRFTTRCGMFPIPESVPTVEWYAKQTTGADKTNSGPSCPALANFYDFRVCCNSCERTIPDAHYHCSKCDDDDFDLCQDCVDKGITCHGDDHWLIKRFKKDGVFITSTTERIAPVVKRNTPQDDDEEPLAARYNRLVAGTKLSPAPTPLILSRTCNCCVRDLPEREFLHCTNCEDYDLCKNCFVKDAHGHHPKHGFRPAVEGTDMPDYVTAKLTPGRNKAHNAICDGCDKFIYGVRHKCLDCPDWDYCNDCVANASWIHPGHRFVPIYEKLADVGATARARPTMHFAITCDGPLCKRSESSHGYITGVRYKCAICPDTDFCASCEASPSNTHNPTHPLIKLKTAIRRVSINTFGEHEDGRPMPQMGDRQSRAQTDARVSETALTSKVSINSVQTVVDVEPTEPMPAKDEVVEEKEVKQEPTPEPEPEEDPARVKEEPEEPLPGEKAPAASDLMATYIRDTVTDGTVLPPNHVFEQTWVLRNTGNVAWPAGCSVRFTGGDYMGHVDSKHPAGVDELESASESTVCFRSLAAGEEFPFTVLLRTPAREGKIISYWRLTAQDGVKFGPRLWCDVSVLAPMIKKESVIELPRDYNTQPPPYLPKAEAPKLPEFYAPTQSSRMIFPKLEKESPETSVHEDCKPEMPAPGGNDVAGDDFEFDQVAEDDEWDASEDGFLTDEEYDILDASDEEYLQAQQKNIKK